MFPRKETRDTKNKEPLKMRKSVKQTSARRFFSLNAVLLSPCLRIPVYDLNYFRVQFIQSIYKRKKNYMQDNNNKKLGSISGRVEPRYLVKVEKSCKYRSKLEEKTTKCANSCPVKSLNTFP